MLPLLAGLEVGHGLDRVALRSDGVLPLERLVRRAETTYFVLRLEHLPDRVVLRLLLPGVLASSRRSSGPNSSAPPPLPIRAPMYSPWTSSK